MRPGVGLTLAFIVADIAMAWLYSPIISQISRLPFSSRKLLVKKLCGKVYFSVLNSLEHPRANANNSMRSAVISFRNSTGSIDENDWSTSVIDWKVVSK